jgi:hypothetical protein
VINHSCKQLRRLPCKASQIAKEAVRKGSIIIMVVACIRFFIRTLAQRADQLVANVTDQCFIY